MDGGLAYATSCLMYTFEGSMKCIEALVIANRTYEE